ncbi:MAG: hypothetical protein ABWW63_07295 [Glaciecola sp.]
MVVINIFGDPNCENCSILYLKDAPSNYVRLFVANHLNDYAKHHPDLVNRITQNWWLPANKARQKLTKHACRTLLKQGHPNTLAQYGNDSLYFFV